MLTVERCVAAAAIVVAGACTTAMNWQFSYRLGATPLESCTLAIFSAALDLMKWLMLPCAAKAWEMRKRMRAFAAVSIWTVAAVYSFTAAVGFAAVNRDASTAQRQQQADLRKTVETIKQSPRWQATAACSDSTTRPSREFCDSYRSVAAQLTAIPAGVDPQSALLARLSGWSIEQVQMALSFFLALACELASALGFFAILATDAGKSSAVPSWKPPRKPSMAKRIASLLAGKWTALAPANWQGSK